MQQHRDAAQNAAAHRKLRFESKMAHVQSILASVQVVTDRTYPTVGSASTTAASCFTFVSECKKN